MGWMIWCKSHYGDLTGSKLNPDYFGWTIKPFSEWWHHPIFTPAGVWTYLSGQLGTFWQGNFLVQQADVFAREPGPLHHPFTGFAYRSFAGVMATIFQMSRHSSARHFRLSMACFGSWPFWVFLSSCPSGMTFMTLTIHRAGVRIFAKGDCWLGALIPFLVLFVYGWDRVLRRLGNPAKFAVLTSMILIMSAVEIVTDWPVFSNPYNWYHLP